ncbi:MAG: hypothetical protein QOF32_96 [Gammaproteobacteria bacterium]|jgi:hypothetical protein|nr:hypothetical protein [Gammaproteobacteria bacterium]
MATPADQRLLELLEKWLNSLELHAKYSSLDDDSYWKIQPWVKHQRPSRWIIDLAMQKTVALRTQVEERIEAGDPKYSDSMELMIFLANLVGSDHIERFIPLADAENERSPAPQPQPGDTVRTAADAVTATREMPKFLVAKRAPTPAGTAQVARTERKAAAVPAKPAAKPAARQPAKPVRPGGKSPLKIEPSEREGPADVARSQVIADAARLVQWGRKWYELPELIARMADRPSLPEVRRILKENKSAIDAKAGGG